MEFDDAYALVLTHKTRLEPDHDDKSVFNEITHTLMHIILRPYMLSLEEALGEEATLVILVEEIIILEEEMQVIIKK